MNDWKVITLADCASFQEGYVNPSKNEPSYFGGTIKWLRATDLNNGFVYKTSQTLTEKGFLSAKKSAVLFEPDSLAISKSGTIGRIGILKDYMCGNRAVINIKVNENICNPLFIFYTLLNSKEQIETLAEGSVQKNLYVSALSKVKLLLLDINKQKEIGYILNTLDQKIELNTQINQTLEQIAQALFKSWFVDFDPVRAKIQALSDGLSLEQAELAAMQAISGKTPEELTALSQTQPDRYAELAETAKAFPCEMVEVDGVEVPKGWELSTIGDCYDVVMGQSPKGETYNENKQGMLFYQGRAEFGWRFPTPRLFTIDPKRIAEQNSILMSVRAPVGDINIALEKCCIGRGLAALQHKSKSLSFGLYQIQSIKPELDLFNGEGTVFGS
ncbi:TPA: restriction endonuclease subunit S, partial [Haemophilus influenzae]